MTTIFTIYPTAKFFFVVHLSSLIRFLQISARMLYVASGKTVNTYSELR